MQISVNFQKTAKKPEESRALKLLSLHVSVERLCKGFPWQQDMKSLQGFCDPSSGEVYLLLRMPVKQDLEVQGDILLVWRSVFKGYSSALIPLNSMVSQI